MMLLDDTMLSNFALVGRIELLTKALRSQIAATHQLWLSNETAVSSLMIEMPVNWQPN